MSERIPTLKNEATRESGLVVPGEYGEGNEATRPEIILPTEQEVRLYNKSRNETKEEKAEIADHQAYEEIIKPINVLHLKEAIDHAQGELGTKSANVNSGRNLSKEANAIREEYIAEYLQTGNKRDLPRPIPHEIRTQLEDLLKMSYKQLEALLGEAEENQENIQPDDEPNLDNGPEDSPNDTPPKKRPKKGPSNPDSGAAVELDIPKSENDNSQEKQADQEPEPDDNPENEPDGDDEPEEEPTKKYEVGNSGNRSSQEGKWAEAIKDEIDRADKLSGYERVTMLGDLALRISQSNPDLAVEAALRIRKSKSRGVKGLIRNMRSANSDYYLYKIATEGVGSIDAANAMGRKTYGRWFRKGKNDAYREIAKLQKDPSVLKDIGTFGLINLHNGTREVSELIDNPEDALENVNGLAKLLGGANTLRKVAVETAKKGNHKRAEQIAKSIKWPKVRNKALHEVAEVVAKYSK